MLAEDVVCERGPDRRRSHRLVLRERRRGYERRQRHRAPLTTAFDTLLAYLSDHTKALLSLLVLANILSVLDLVLTRALLHHGVVEGNPIMRYFFRNSAVQAAAVKFGLIAAASLAIWALRRRRAAVEAALFLAGLYGAVVLYEVLGLVRLA
jgi:hypothetical protein